MCASVQPTLTDVSHVVQVNMNNKSYEVWRWDDYKFDIAQTLDNFYQVKIGARLGDIKNLWNKKQSIESEIKKNEDMKQGLEKDSAVQGTLSAQAALAVAAKIYGEIIVIKKEELEANEKEIQSFIKSLSTGKMQLLSFLKD